MVLAALLVVPLISTSLIPVNAYYEGFTHAVYIESVVGTWCLYCRADNPSVAQAFARYSRSLHFVMFHVSVPGRPDEWSIDYGMQKLKEYRSDATPTHAYDAGRIVSSGALNQTQMELVGRRSVHRITLAVLKRVEGRQLSFEGSIKEEDGKPFNGRISVIAVENGLQSMTLTWNHVFRAYLLTQNVSLTPSQYRLFSGAWTVPSDVDIGNVGLVVAAFDFVDRSEGGGAFAVQSVSDVNSGTVIPEFNLILATTGSAMLASLVILRPTRRRVRVSR